DTVSLPAKIKVNASTETYTFKSEHQTEKLFVADVNNGVKIRSKTVKDTIEIQIENPFDIALSAFAMHRGNRMFLNIDSTGVYKFAMKTHERLSVYVQYLWAGKAQQGVNDYQLYEKKLRIETNLPEITFPGKEAEVEIKISNYLEKPVAGVNLTVLSYNDQFKESFLPHIPDYGYKAAPTKIPDDQSLSIQSYPSRKLLITHFWVREFGLQHSVYYRALLADENGFRYSLPLEEDDYPQLAVYAVQNKKFV